MRQQPAVVKCAGGAGAVGSPPALIVTLGGKKIDIPTTPEAVWKVLQAA
ncbi:hypothetical protein [Acidisphaera sp. L21]|nr:hypothetical protein [Acidisphaera sp. L21]